MKLSEKTTLVEWKDFKFLIFDAPTLSTIDAYLKDMMAIGVTDVVRVCDPTYDKQILESNGITLHDLRKAINMILAYPDGDPPPKHIIDAWLDLVDERRNKKNPASTGCCIGIHCVAGLGRAPALVALALIEGGMAPLDSVIYIRERRRGAINAKQLKFLEAYKKRKPKAKKCLIM